MPAGVYARTYSEVSINQKTRDLIIGTTLGDAHIHQRKETHNPWLGVKHCIQDIDYLEWKYEILKAAHLTGAPPYYYNKGFCFNTACHPALQEFRNLFYPDGHKIVSAKILGMVTPLSLAVWFMDDGNLWVKQGVKHNFPRMELHTECFSQQENILIQEWFKDTYNIGVRLQSVKLKRGNGFVLRTRGKRDVWCLIDTIALYVHPCMLRKIGG